MSVLPFVALPRVFSTSPEAGMTNTAAFKRATNAWSVINCKGQRLLWTHVNGVANRKKVNGARYSA